MLVVPVILPPGLARLATSPVATGSKVATNTTGIWPAASLAGNTDGVPEARIMSTLRRTSSAAASGTCAALGAKLYSMTKCWSSTKPCSRSPCRKPSMKAAGGGPTRNKPMRLIFPVSCAKAAVALAIRGQPSRMTNSRRLMTDPKPQTMVERATDVRYGSQADILRCESDVRFTPKSGHLKCNNPCLL